MSLSELRNLGIVADNGTINGYSDLTGKQAAQIIFAALNIIKAKSAVELELYLDTNCPAGRSIHKPYFDLITYRIVKDYVGRAEK